MRIAILSDIHGNDIALSAVLDQVKAKGITSLFLLGDYLGYYYNTSTVFDLLAPFEKEMIKGNHEVMLEESQDDDNLRSNIKEKYGSGLEAARQSLSKEQRAHLCALPEKKELAIDGVKILLCHGSPWDIDQYMYPDSDMALKERCLESGADFVFLGHSHHPFIHQGEKGTLVNVGSVGQNRSLGGIANWATLDTETKQCEIQETPYEISALIEQVQENDPQNKYLHQVLLRGEKHA